MRLVEWGVAGGRMAHVFRPHHDDSRLQRKSQWVAASSRRLLGPDAHPHRHDSGQYLRLRRAHKHVI